MLSKEKPDHLAVAFDNGGSQLRNEIFQNIKRTVMPPEAIKLPYIQALLKAMHIPLLKLKA
jgi:DNA polymerase-1